MDTAPLRALITRPRGGVETQQPAPPSATGRLENLESRRRLQGTLLTCSIYKKSPIAAETAALVLFTNDSSGNPKGCCAPTRTSKRQRYSTAKALEVTADDRILTTVPLYHSYGFDCGLMLALRFGATLYLEDEVAPKRIVKLLREQEINVLPGTPGLYAGLAKLPTAKALKVKKPRYLSAGSLLSEATAEAFKARWGIRIVPLYHTTETSTIACDRKEPRPGSVGKVVEGVEVRVGDPSGKNGTSEEDGPIWVKSKSVARKSMPQTAHARRGRCRSAASTTRAGCAPATSATSTRPDASISPGAKISWSRSTASASRSARCRSASSRSPRCSRRRCASSPIRWAGRWWSPASS